VNRPVSQPRKRLNSVLRGPLKKTYPSTKKNLPKLKRMTLEEFIVGKKLFGAVVGIIVNSRAQALALKNGLYVVKIREEEEKLDIDKPDSCQTW